MVSEHTEQLHKERTRESFQVVLSATLNCPGHPIHALAALDARNCLQLTCSLPEGAPDVERV